jgi:hypothetical protein
LSVGGITECYCWIRRHTRNNNTARATLEPAYQIIYDWANFGWTVTRLTVITRV